MRAALRPALVLSSLCLVLSAGCTSGTGLAGNPTDGGNEDLVGADLSAPDLTAAPDLAPPSAIGRPCPMGNECANGLLCLAERLNAFFPAVGYCSRFCAADADCGAGAWCAPPLGAAGRLCFATCGAGDSCAYGGQLCSRRLFGLVASLTPVCLPGNPQARDGDGCRTFGDCNRNQACLTNPFAFPGGMCLTIGCTVGDDTTCAGSGDGLCLPNGPSSLCADRCMTTADCRANESYVCMPLPTTNFSICSFPHNEPGAPCAVDTDCGITSSPWRCLTGGNFPGGYCSGPRGLCNGADDNSCPYDSRCFDATPAAPRSGDEYCARNCNADADCRTKDTYRCLPVDPMAMGGVSVCRKP